MARHHPPLQGKPRVTLIRFVLVNVPSELSFKTYVSSLVHGGNVSQTRTIYQTGRGEQVMLRSETFVEAMAMQR